MLQMLVAMAVVAALTWLNLKETSSTDDLTVRQAAELLATLPSDDEREYFRTKTTIDYSGHLKMGYLLIKFQEHVAVEEAMNLIANLPFVYFLGSFYEFEKKRLQDRKLDMPNGPLRSLEDLTRREGDAERIVVNLTSGSVLSGQLRTSGLLVGNKECDPETVRGDNNVARVVTILTQNVQCINVEVSGEQWK